jgi:hypothetical protein
MWPTTEATPRTFFGFLILAVTGIWLAQFYHAMASTARESIAYIMNVVPLGDLVRGIHFWVANIVMATVLLHMGRVFVTGSAPLDVQPAAGVVADARAADEAIAPRERTPLDLALIGALIGLLAVLGGLLAWRAERFGGSAGAR